MTDNNRSQWADLDATFLQRSGALVELTDWIQIDVRGRDVTSYLGRLSSYQVADIENGGGARTFCSMREENTGDF